MAAGQEKPVVLKGELGGLHLFAHCNLPFFTGKSYSMEKGTFWISILIAVIGVALILAIIIFS